MGLTQIYRGAGTGRPFCKKYGKVFYDQTNLGIALCNVQNMRVWAGSTTTKPILNVVGTKGFAGASTSNCLYNYDLQSGIIYRGAGVEDPLYLWKGSTLYEGAGRTKVILNWTGDIIGLPDVLALITLLKTR
jgi:lysozyme family protein